MKLNQLPTAVLLQMAVAGWAGAFCVLRFNKNRNGLSNILSEHRHAGSSGAYLEEQVGGFIWQSRRQPSIQMQKEHEHDCSQSPWSVLGAHKFL
jgi:hypothetical protein